MLVMWTLYFIMPNDFIIPLTTITAGFVIQTFISVFENLDSLGSKVPKFILERLRDHQDNLNGNYHNEESDLDE